MDKKELQKAQSIIDALFYDDKALTQWQHTLLENVISIAQTKLRQPDVISSKKFELTYDELYKLISEGYRNGYAIYEMADAGLEPYDADGYTRWVLLGLK